ncbi:MAG: Grx4 family monothiol glutaredoxin [Chlamydiota bacterium]
MSTMQEKIQKELENHPIILFMKGSKPIPLCGFSARVVDVLNRYGVEYETRDVLKDDALRSAIKEFSNWSTLPQLYVRGKFVGGCDIVLQLHEEGKLKTMLEEL